MDMNHVQPTLVSSIFSFSRRTSPQPIFTPAMPTQVYITKDTTTHIDPPPGLCHLQGRKNTPSPTSSPDTIFDEKRQYDYFVYPATPCAPSSRQTTFFLPLTLSGPRYRDDDQASIDSDRLSLGVPSGHTIICHPTVPGVYTVAEPKTLARALFFFGFLFPAFWMVGIAILVMPLRPTPDWEAGKTCLEVEWACKIIRQTELRWARWCLIALLVEIALIVSAIFVVKFTMRS